MSEQLKTNLGQRLGHIRGQLGQLAYQRREHELAIEKIDLQVTQMEAQGVMLEATQQDFNFDEARNAEEALKEREDERQKRSKRAKAAAAKKKGKTPEKASRKGKGTTGA